MDSPTWLFYAVFLGLVAFYSTGCSGSRGVVDLGHDGIALIGTAEGMRAFGDMQNGIISNSRISPDKKSAFWEQRNLEAAEVTKRSQIESFWGKVFGN